MPLQMIREDLTRVKADAIVNTANPEPTYGAGTDYAVYQAAGADRLLKYRQKIGFIHPGQAAVTPAFRLPAKYIIHTVGPVWQGGNSGEKETLRSFYENSLQKAKELKCRSIAFPLISSGSYGFPKGEALEIALQAIQHFLETEDMTICLVVFDEESVRLSEALDLKLEKFIDERLVSDKLQAEYLGQPETNRFPASVQGTSIRQPSMPVTDSERQFSDSGIEPDMQFSDSGMAPDMQFSDSIQGSSSFTLEPDKRLSSPSKESGSKHFSAADHRAAGKLSKTAHMPASDDRVEKPLFPKRTAVGSARSPHRNLEDVIGQLGETFQERLLRLIDERGLSDVEVYKQANLDRKLFSKIRCNPQYKPKKKTALALAIALHLNLDETKDLLGRAELALSPSSVFDLIIEYFIVNEVYDIYTINVALFQHRQPLLGK